MVEVNAKIDSVGVDLSQLVELFVMQIESIIWINKP